ncbi:MAG TPA: hypothetical protein VFC21_01390 [Bryobacteraceae bacterium]|nr:hypothetical protein [Bryobacteraceae bacterium]
MIQQLRDQLEEFLKARIYSKPEDDRTKRDDLTEAAIDTLDELLIKYQVAERQAPGAKPAEPQNRTSEHTDSNVTSVLRSYVEINRDYDLMGEDVALAELLRSGRRGRRNGSQ